MTDFDPVTNPDAQEAGSAKYSAQTINVIQLRSGRFALHRVRGAERTLWKIEGSLDELLADYFEEQKLSRQLAREAEKKLAAQVAEKREIELELSDLIDGLEL